MTSDIEVQLANGVYRLSQPLRFGADDSGANGHTVTWTAALGAKPTITGAQRVTGWKQVDATKNIWVASIPKGLETRQLLVDNKLATRARTAISRSDVRMTPTGMDILNSNLNYLARLPQQSRIEVNSLNSWTNRYAPVASISGTTVTMQQPAWNNNTIGYDVIQAPFVNGPFYLENSLAFLDSAGEWFDDTQAGKLYYSPRAGQTMSGVSVELPTLPALISVGGTLDAPAHDIGFRGLTFTGTSWIGPSSPQGYADQQTGGYLVGDWPRPNDAFYSCTFGCEDFEATRPNWSQMPAAVQVSAADNISFDSSTFTGLGSYGIGIGQDKEAVLTGVGLGASNVSVTNSVITDIAAGGIVIGGIKQDAHHPSDPRMINKNFTITGNTISHNGVDYKDIQGVLATYTENANISHNDLSDLPYSAVSLGYGWGVNDPGGSVEYQRRGLYNHQPVFDTPTTAKNNTVSQNRISRFMQEMNDGGCFYALSASPGSRIDENFCDGPSEFQGLYFDEGARYFGAEHNVLVNFDRWANDNYQFNSNTGNETIRSNWVTTLNQGLAPNDFISATTLVNGTSLPCAARQIVARSGARSVAPNPSLYDSVSSAYQTSQVTASSFGQCGPQFGITTSGSATSGAAAQDAAYAAVGTASSFGSSGSATARVDSVPTQGKAGVMVRNSVSDRSSAGHVSLGRTATQVVLSWDRDGDGTLDNTTSANVAAGAPVWLRLSRNGSQYAASYSTDGTTYQQMGAPVTLTGVAANQQAANFASQAFGSSGTSQLSGLAVTYEPFRTTSTNGGSVVASPDGFTFSAAGRDAWWASHDDDYTAAYLPDGIGKKGVATVQVTSQQRTSDYAKAGLVIRNDLTDTERGQGYASLSATPDHGIILASDSNGDGFIDTEARASIASTTGVQLRIVRDGDTLTGQYSTDGQAWTEVGKATLIGAEDKEDIGVFSLSHSADGGTTTLGSLNVSEELPPPPPPSELTAYTTNGGTTTGTPASSSITGRGADVWGGGGQHDDDYTAYYYTGTFGAASTATVQVDSQQNTSRYAKSGLMVRNKMNAAGSSAGYALIAVTPGYGIVLASDSDGDGYTDTEARADVSTSYPVQLRLARSGSAVTGSYSTDGGTTWTTVGSATLSGAADAQDIGEFATSHNTGTSGTTTFKNFKVTTDAAPTPTVDVQTSSRCVSGKVTLVVQLENKGTTPVDVAIDTPYGSKTLTSVAAGKTVSNAFTTRVASISAGTIKTTSNFSGKKDAAPKEQAFDAKSCS